MFYKRITDGFVYRNAAVARWIERESMTLARSLCFFLFYPFTIIISRLDAPRSHSCIRGYCSHIIEANILTCNALVRLWMRNNIPKRNITLFPRRGGASAFLKFAHASNKNVQVQSNVCPTLRSKFGKTEPRRIRTQAGLRHLFTTELAWTSYRGYCWPLWIIPQFLRAPSIEV